MDKLEFLNKLQREVKKNYPEIEDVIVDKNDTENITIKLNDNVFKVDTNEIYDFYEEGLNRNWTELSLMVQLKIMRHLYKKNSADSRNNADYIFSNKEEFLNRVIFECADVEDSAEIAKNCPNIRKFGLTFFYSVIVNKIDGCVDVTAIAEKKTISSLGITEEELYNRAYQNTKKKYEMCIALIGDKVLEMGIIPKENIPSYKEMAKEYNIFNVPLATMIYSETKGNVESLLMAVDNFDRIGAVFKEGYYLVINDPFTMTAYPESVIKYSDIEKIRDTLYQDLVIHYKDGEIMLK